LDDFGHINWSPWNVIWMTKNPLGHIKQQVPLGHWMTKNPLGHVNWYIKVLLWLEPRFARNNFIFMNANEFLRNYAWHKTIDIDQTRPSPTRACVWASLDYMKHPPFGILQRPLRSLKLSPDATGRLCPGLIQTTMKSVLLTLLIVSGFAGCVFAEGDGSTDYCLIGAGPGGILVVCTGRISFIFIFQNYSSFWTIVLAKYRYKR